MTHGKSTYDTVTRIVNELLNSIKYIKDLESLRVKDNVKVVEESDNVKVVVFIRRILKYPLIEIYIRDKNNGESIMLVRESTEDEMKCSRWLIEMATSLDNFANF